ncbi:glycosyltransferase family 39 protein [Bdellovibrio bacteriovorus]|uniref:ArnT family glycosyltransferase n=1 Tax=Bdellovibrio bacteriovorus TaxID=959 RepID=UPI0021D00B0A|nr:glycosyltransferase family 39 protein [Bdellovibrio bacteriovorus]UXR65812.1 glycosyltransferase family 39 protein [Bdellovibrio bacteriovorus]
MKELLRIWWVSLVVKLVLSALIPLSADEAYYWVWSQRPQLSYFDHPPLVSWLFYLGHIFEPLMHAVRWPAVIFGHLLIGIWILLLKDRLPWDKIKIWIYLVLLSPLLGFGSLIVTPDLPVMTFWSLALLLTVHALEKKDLPSYLGLGIALGLGFCAKYHIVLFVPCLLAYLTFEKRWKDVRFSGVFATIIAGLIFSSPVIIWNAQNGFASFEFQIKHGLERTSYNPEWTVSYILGQILILFPLIFWAALRAHVPRNLRWLLYFGWGPLLFFLLTSFRALVEANWPIIAYPAVLATALFHQKIQKWARVSVAFWGLIIVLVISTLFTPSLRKLSDKVEEPYVFQKLSSIAYEYSPLYASSYQMASSLWYFSKVPVFKLKDISRFDFFDTLPEAQPQGNVFYLVKRKTNGLPKWISEQQWQMKEIKTISPDFVVLEFTRP